MLEANGLVSKRHFAGYATSPRMDRAQLDELFEFRLLIESHAARKAGTASMMADGFAKCREGLTTIEELGRVTSED